MGYIGMCRGMGDGVWFLRFLILKYGPLFPSGARGMSQVSQGVSFLPMLA